MSQPNTIAAAPRPAGAPRQPLHQTIARAAQATGAEFNYLLAQAKLESALDPSARAATSSAAGLYQFTRGTWLQTLDKHGADHGLGWVAQAIEGGQVRDPEMRARIMALRFDPAVSSVMAGELAGDNRAALTSALGRQPDAGELYLAHFLGAGGAVKLLSADPATPAAALLPEAAAANRAVFNAPGGAPRSAGEVVALVRGKMATAMGGTTADLPLAEPFAPPPGWPASSPAFAAPAFASLPGLPAAPPAASAPRPSMADTLLASFGGNAAAAPAHVRAAYGKLRSFAL